MMGRRKGLILAVACAALIASVALVGQLQSMGGSTVVLGEDGEMYYGTFIPNLDFGGPRSAAKGEVVMHDVEKRAIPALHAFVPEQKVVVAPKAVASAPQKAAAEVAHQPVQAAAASTHKAATPIKKKAASASAAAAAAVPRNAPVGVLSAAAAAPVDAPPRPAKAANAAGVAAAKASPSHGAPTKPAAFKPPSAADKLKSAVDANLAVLEKQAKRLGINYGSRVTAQLDDLPIPNIEPGTDSTPSIAWPEARRPRKMMLEDSEGDHNYSGEESFVTDEDWDNAGELEKAGINVHEGFESENNNLFADHKMTERFNTVHPARGGGVFFDKSVPVEEVEREEREAEGREVGDNVPVEAEGRDVGDELKVEVANPAKEYSADPEAAREARDEARSSAAPGTDEAAASSSANRAAAGLEVHGPAKSAPDAGPDDKSSSPLAAAGLKGAASESKLWQVAKEEATHKLYADASSPDYLEPQKHQKVYDAAWKWAAKMRAAHLGMVDDVKEHKGAKLAPVVQLAQQPCPWYGCPDGSDSVFERRREAKQQQHQAQQLMLAKAEDAKLAMAKKILAHPVKAAKTAKAAPVKTAKASAVNIAEAAPVKAVKAAKINAKAAPVKQQSLHLAHGYGTTNAFPARPLNAKKNQYYGRDHSHSGSSLPTTSHGGVVKGKMPYSNDVKKDVYDMDRPTSFDSIPLAEDSSFASKVAAHQPAGDGHLAYSEFKGSLLAAWRKYEHGLSQCMEAEATLDPSLKDYACGDVKTGLGYLQGCMQRHDFGLASLAQADAKPTWWRGMFGQEGRKSGAWGALPKLLSMSRQLSPEDYAEVYGVLSRNAVFAAMWRMENLQTRCATTGSAYRPDGLKRRNEIKRIDDEIKSMSRSLSRDYPGTEEMRVGEARVQGRLKGSPWEYNAVQRGSVRNYWPNVMSKWPQDGSEANLPNGEYYGPETAYDPAPVFPHQAARGELPSWRTPMYDGDNPAGITGTYGDYVMQQPRAKLDGGKGSGFPLNVNGRKVSPGHARPYEVQSGGLSGYAQHYTWVGPGPYDYVPLASPDALRQGYSYPSTLWPKAGRQCVEDRECGARSVCGTAAICVEWDQGMQPYRAPAQGGSWPTDVTPDWV